MCEIRTRQFTDDCHEELNPEPLYEDINDATQMSDVKITRDGAPSKTRFNRTRGSTNNGVTTPIEVMTESHCGVLKEGVYDIAGENRLRGEDQNVYSHCVDTVYDTSDYTRQKEGNDDNYDNVVVHRREDGNHISS